MKPRHLTTLLGLAALVATLRSEPAQANPGMPELPGTTPPKNASPEEKKAPPAPAEKKSDPKDAATTAAPSAAAPEKSAAVPSTTAAKLKSIFTASIPPPAKPPVPPPQLSPRFQQMRQRMEALFASRNNPPPPPDARLNPFRPPGAIPVAPLATKDVVVEAAPVSNNLVLLQQAVATLKVRGTVQRGKSLQLVINSGPGHEGTYKEGDIININLSPDPVHLRVRVIALHSVTFTLSDAEMVLNF